MPDVVRISKQSNIAGVLWQSPWSLRLSEWKPMPLVEEREILRSAESSNAHHHHLRFTHSRPSEAPSKTLRLLNLFDVWFITAPGKVRTRSRCSDQHIPSRTANSPPLHHPVPQHVSTVPQLRSPPLPVPPNGQPHSGYGYGQQSPAQGQMGAGQSYVHPAFGGFINDPTAQMGFQVGKNAMMAGQEYVEQNVSLRHLPRQGSG